MSRKLWMAHLVKSSPRYQDWFSILRTDEVPLMSSRSFKADLGGVSTEVYSIELASLDRSQTTRLLQFIVENFACSAGQAMRYLESDGFPIRAEDVLVSFDLRCFI